jgi:chorismate-pyruvate lyase
MRYTVPLGGYFINSPGTGVKSVTNSQSSGSQLFHFVLPRDITTRDIIHIQAGVKNNYASDASVTFLLCTTKSSFASSTVKQTITGLHAEEADSNDYPTAAISAAVHSDLVTAASQEDETDGKGKGFRLWARTSASATGTMYLRGITMWLERMP